MKKCVFSEADRWELSDEPVEEGLMWGSLDHLEPNEQYQVRILALAHDGGDTRPSEPYTFKTAGFGEFSACQVERNKWRICTTNLWCEYCELSLSQKMAAT